MEIFLKGKLFSQQREPISVINPANGALIDTIPDMVEEDVDLAVATARAAFPDWARRSQWQRSGLIEKFLLLVEAEKEDLARLLSDETGKPMAEARGETGACLLITKGYCERANHMYGNCLPRGDEVLGNINDVVFTRREPIGVFGCVIPFNFPLAMFVWSCFRR